MPLTIADLSADSAETSLEFAGQTVALSYRPAVNTPANDKLPIVTWLSLALITWDLTGDDGEPYPTTTEALQVLPDRFLKTVLREIVRHDAASVGPTKSASVAG